MDAVRSNHSNDTKASRAPATKKPSTSRRTSSTPKKSTAQAATKTRDSAKLSREAKGSGKPAGPVPDFKKSFSSRAGKGEAKAPAKTGSSPKPGSGAERSALDEASKAALQTRVIAGQGAGVKGGPLPSQSGTVRKLGAAGGLGAGVLAFKQGRAALDRSKAAGERAVSGLQAAASTAHATHGATQAADLFRANKLNPAPPSPGTLKDIPGKLTQAAGAVKDKAAQIPGAALKGIAAPTNAAGTALTGAQRLAVTAGRAAPLLGGVAQLGQSAYDISKNGLTTENAANGISGGAKLVGAGLVASGIGAPIGAALIAGSTAYDLGKLAYDNREAIGNAASQALSGLRSAGRAALGAIPGLGSLSGGIGRLFG